MYPNNLSSILCFILLFSFGYVSAQKCGDSMFFRPNGTYDTNRRLILSTLASNVSSQDGYFIGSVGEGPERIYALGLCIPDTDPKICSNCIQLASFSLLQNCPYQTDSFDWRSDKTLCFVRYSNSSFFDQLDLVPSTQEHTNGLITENVLEFTSIWDDFMEDMVVSASYSTPGSLARKHYAANVSLATQGLQRFYTLMFCIPGITSMFCDACLQANIRDYKDCCGMNTGGSIRRPVCFFQWDVNPLLGVFENITSQGTVSDLPNGKKISTGTIVGIVITSALFVTLLILGLVVWKRRQSDKTSNLKTHDGSRDQDSLQFDFNIIEAATDNFARNKKVGQGGFGEVYKGTFSNGTEVAVKRLSRMSRQGTQAFKNEVMVVAKLKHRNLVRLLGFCLEGDEKILIYEFVHNKSLDYFLFDPTKRRELDWTRRYNIIMGIVRGILYLHQDSQLTIIHRDLKAGNILLDDDMDPKIADFGMARIFGIEQTEDNTSKIAGTFGYMAPEYAMHGRFSMKSDVYSFGVLVLEIISGKQNSSFYQTDGSAGNLVTHAWRLWRKGSALELLDSTFGDNYRRNEVTRCIHIALLCVQEDPEDRPMMSRIILMLTSNTITLQVPRAPGFFFQSRRDQDSNPKGSHLSRNPVSCSISDETITDLDPR